jgi:hypothetical protein
MGEILEARLSADHWSDRQGQKIRLGEIPLLETEIVAAAALDTGNPSEEEFEGYTGNAGMTLERWYHRAAVVIWPREKHFAVLCEAGIDAALGGLEPMVKQLRRAAQPVREAQRQDCLRFAAAIIDAWRRTHRRQSWSREEKIDRSIFPRLLCELDDPGLLGSFLNKVLAVDGDTQLDAAFVAFCKLHGWSRFEGELRSVIKASGPETLVRNAEWLQRICRQRDRNPERLALCVRLCRIFVDTLKGLDRKPVADPWRYRQINRTALLVSAVNAMLAIDAQLPLSGLIQHALSSRDKYELTDTQLAAIFALEPLLGKLTKPNEAISLWLAACREALQSRTATPPVKPQDYRRTHELSCSCGDCRQLSRFLADPKQRQVRLPLKKERRQHVHQIIESNSCDLTHVTERVGRPFTLVCTKTEASYQQARKIHVRDVNNLARIENLVKRLPG